MNVVAASAATVRGGRRRASQPCGRRGHGRGRVLAWLAVLACACALAAIAPPGAVAAPGDLDASFGTGGRVTGPLGVATASGLQADGKLLVAGWGLSGGTYGIARYNLDGTPDTSYGTGGVAATSAPDVAGQAGGRGQALLVQSDGAIVAGNSPSAYPDGPGVGLARFTSAGVLDQSFGSGGAVHAIPPGGLTNAAVAGIAATPDGGFAVVASTPSCADGSGACLIVGRFNADGSLDTAFGSGGWATVGQPADAGGYPTSLDPAGISVQPDGKLVVAGWPQSGSGGATYGWIASRLNSDGTLDTTYGAGGVARGGGGENIYTSYLQPDGKLLLAGEDGNCDMYVRRLNGDGSVDTAFGSGGLATVNLGTCSYAYALALDSEGRILVGGSAFAFGLARLTPAGALDPGFGNGGYVVTSGDGEGEINGISVLPDGRLAVSGTSTQSGGCNCQYGALSVAGLQLASGSADYYPGPNPLLRFAGQASFTLAGVGVEGRLSGFADDSAFDVDGSVTINVWGQTINGQAVVSSTGLGACATVHVIAWDVSVGLGYTWGGSPQFLANSCDLGPWRVQAPAADAARAGGARSFLLPRGLHEAAFKVIGAGRTPKLTISGPGGRKITSSADGSIVKAAGAILIEDPVDHVTYVVLGQPQGGAWRIQPQPGSSFTTVQTAQRVAPPKLSARVSSRGARRILQLGVHGVTAGETITVLERGRYSTRTLGRLLTRSALLAFTPAAGPAGVRQIVAVVQRRGVPLERVTLTSFRVAGAPPLRAPRSLAIHRHGLRVMVSWHAVPGARSYLVHVRFPSGRRLLLATSAPAVQVDGVGVQAVTATVQARGENGPSAPSRAVQLAAPKLPRAPAAHKPRPRRKGR